MTFKTSPDHEEMMLLAKNYPNPHRWAGEHVTARALRTMQTIGRYVSGENVSFLRALVEAVSVSQ